MTALTDRFSRAVDYARIAHAAQVRTRADSRGVRGVSEVFVFRA